MIEILIGHVIPPVSALNEELIPEFLLRSLRAKFSSWRVSVAEGVALVTQLLHCFRFPVWNGLRFRGVEAAFPVAM